MAGNATGRKRDLAKLARREVAEDGQGPYSEQERILKQLQSEADSLDVV
jgi:hypothetical protein